MSETNFSSTVGAAEQALHIYYVCGENPDMSISCGRMHYILHSATILPTSAVLAAAHEDRPDAESAWDYAMDDEEPETVARLVTYLHTNDYGYETRPAPGRPAPPPQSTQRSLLATADLYALAARYEMAGLAALATSKFDSLRQGYWPFDDFAELLDAVYLKTPASYLGLRDLLADSCALHPREILAAPLRTALARHGDLAGAVLQIVNRRYADAAVTGLMAHKETAVALLDARNSLAAVREELAEAREELEEVREERDWAVRVIHGPVGIVPPAA